MKMGVTTFQRERNTWTLNNLRIWRMEYLWRKEEGDLLECEGAGRKKNETFGSVE